MRWVRYAAAGLLIILLGGGALLYGASEWMIRRTHAVPPLRLAADHSTAGIAEGERLGHVLGCLSCHGPEGHGQTLIDQPMVARLTAPALAPMVVAMDDGQLERVLHQAVQPDGRTLWVMPNHATLADEDVARLIGWLRTLHPSHQDLLLPQRFGPMIRVAMLGGMLPASATERRVSPARRPTDVGAYFAGLSCLGCHALHEPREREGQIAPPLAAAAAAYDEAAFHRLLRTGIGIGNRKLGLMGDVARGAFSHFSDDEMRAIHAYLVRAPSEPPPG